MHTSIQSFLGNSICDILIRGTIRNLARQIENLKIERNDQTFNYYASMSGNNRIEWLYKPSMLGVFRVFPLLDKEPLLHIHN